MRLFVAFIFAALDCGGVAVAAPAVGDTYVYRVINAYNNEVRGQVTHRVDRIEAGQVFVSVTSEPPSLVAPFTEVAGADGNWLRHPLINHDAPVEYEFSPAFPAYIAPLEKGRSWSTRVNATNPASGKRVSVRVDGEVLGNERVTTPAGSFDAIKIRRRIYAGDWEMFTMETNITETEWFAPALGRTVKLDHNSGYIDTQRCGNVNVACTPVRGDWFLYELVSSVRK